MNQYVFLSHCRDDFDVVQELAPALEAQGYCTWYYERDSVPGASYLLQTGMAIEACQAFVLLISPSALASHQVTKELVRAHEHDKPLIPILRGISHAEFQRRQPEWREALGSATSVSLTDAGAAALAPRLAEGLRALGLKSARSKGPLKPPTFSGVHRPSRAPGSRLAMLVAVSLAVGAGLCGGSWFLWKLGTDVSSSAAVPTEPRRTAQSQTTLETDDAPGPRATKPKPQLPAESVSGVRDEATPSPVPTAGVVALAPHPSLPSEQPRVAESALPPDGPAPGGAPPAVVPPARPSRIEGKDKASTALASATEPTAGASHPTDSDQDLETFRVPPGTVELETRRVQNNEVRFTVRGKGFARDPRPVTAWMSANQGVYERKLRGLSADSGGWHLHATSDQGRFVDGVFVVEIIARGK